MQIASHYIHFRQYTKDYSGVGRKCNVFYRFQGLVATAVKCLDGTTFESVSTNVEVVSQGIILLGWGTNFIVIQVSICTVFETTW